MVPCHGLGYARHENLAGDISGSAPNVQDELGLLPVDPRAELFEDVGSVALLEVVGVLVKVGVVHHGDGVNDVLLPLVSLFHKIFPTKTSLRCF